LSSGREGFCVTQPAISVLQSPVNKFTVLTIEDTIRGQSRVLLSKSGELTSSRSSISVHIIFLSFLASSVCIMQCDAF